jgi:hypothetical protein
MRRQRKPSTKFENFCALAKAKGGSASPENASPARTDGKEIRRRRKHISGGKAAATFLSTC